MAANPEGSAAGDPPDIPGAEHRFGEIETADVGRLRLHWHEAGDGPPVLMLHGWPQHGWCWHKVAPLLAGRHRVICPDLRGFGWSDAPGRGYDPDTFAADAVALLDALALDRVDLVGHDWGGYAGFIACLTRPERFRRFLVLNTGSPWARPSPRLLASSWRSWYAALNAMPVAGQRLQQSERWIRWILRNDAVHEGITEADAEVYTARLRPPERARAAVELYRAYWRIVARAGRGDWQSHRLTVPTRFVFGTKDRFITRLLAGGWEPNADDMRVEWVEDSGHFIQEEKPELVAERALELFSG
jgi:pimeloyl-ACP methyl ester carboxylesterase